jgi:CRP/FNR family transcriptional regulator, anaerobic regulatory protein
MKNCGSIDTGPARSIEGLHSGCGTCLSQNFCWSNGHPVEPPWLKDLTFARRRVKRGAALYRMGDPFQSLYAVRAGFFKTRTLLEDGRDQVTGFQMTGELLGFDGIGTNTYTNDAVALEDSELCIIPYLRMIELSGRAPGLACEVHRMMSRELVREQGMMALLGTMQAEERIIVFLLNLSARLRARHFSATCFILRMTREEIGSYLGLKLETVSRVFSRLQSTRLIEIANTKQITLRDVDQLRQRLGERLPTEALEPPSPNGLHAVRRTLPLRPVPKRAPAAAARKAA